MEKYLFTFTSQKPIEQKRKYKLAPWRETCVATLDEASLVVEIIGADLDDYDHM